MLISDGMSEKDAQARIAYLNQLSRTPEGQDNVAIAAGYGASSGDGSLANVFETFRAQREVSGAPHRLIARSKPIAAILAIAGLVIALLLGRSWGEAIGVGLVLGVATLGIALAMYRQSVAAPKP